MGTAEHTAIEADIPGAFAELFQPWRYKVFYGGRGKAVSWSFARTLLIRGAVDSLRILCTRELQTSIKDSVHRLLEDQVRMLGLKEVYHVNNNEVRSKINDTSFIFKGLRHNVEEIKSMEGVDIVWVAEAQKCSDNSWKVLIPTIRKENEGHSKKLGKTAKWGGEMLLPTSEIWVDFNTGLETDPTYQRFITNTPPKTFVKKVSYRDNPFFPQVLREEMEWDRKVDPESAANIWDGELAIARPGAIFKGKWRVDSFIPGPDWDGPYQGADWGFSQDPTVLMRVWVYQRKLYIEYESWKLKCELDDIPALFDQIPMARNHKIMGDSARPDTISHIKRKGWTIEGAEKYKGSVEEGVTFLMSFEEIVIHERCPHMIAEAKNYSYKLDILTGDPVKKIEDKHNHCWDAIRYALHKMISLSRRFGRPSIRTFD